MWRRLSRVSLGRSTGTGMAFLTGGGVLSISDASRAVSESRYAQVTSRARGTRFAEDFRRLWRQPRNRNFPVNSAANVLGGLCRLRVGHSGFLDGVAAAYQLRRSAVVNTREGTTKLPSCQAALLPGLFRSETEAEQLDMTISSLLSQVEAADEEGGRGRGSAESRAGVAATGRRKGEIGGHEVLPCSIGAYGVLHPEWLSSGFVPLALDTLATYPQNDAMLSLVLACFTPISRVPLGRSIILGDADLETLGVGEGGLVESGEDISTSGIPAQSKHENHSGDSEASQQTNPSTIDDDLDSNPTTPLQQLVLSIKASLIRDKEAAAAGNPALEEQSTEADPAMVHKQACLFFSALCDEDSDIAGEMGKSAGVEHHLRQAIVFRSSAGRHDGRNERRSWMHRCCAGRHALVRPSRGDPAVGMPGSLQPAVPESAQQALHVSARWFETGDQCATATHGAHGSAASGDRHLVLPPPIQ
eukprot:scaffold1070_cov245-Pinguiococcus_pyrenoidosus.AAC.33